MKIGNITLKLERTESQISIFYSTSFVSRKNEEKVWLRREGLLDFVGRFGMLIYSNRSGLCYAASSY